MERLVSRWHIRSLLLIAVSLLPGRAGAFGARLFKSGPIQVTADGKAVWVANAHGDSVSRIDTVTYASSEFPLPADPAAPSHAPHGLSVSEDGAEVARIRDRTTRRDLVTKPAISAWAGVLAYRVLVRRGEVVVALEPASGRHGQATTHPCRETPRPPAFRGIEVSVDAILG